VSVFSCKSTLAHFCAFVKSYRRIVISNSARAIGRMPVMASANSAVFKLVHLPNKPGVVSPGIR
jgi:hypothetical protein